ncbi:MAG: helix-turn-helix domain-containing protein [Flavobacteriales bacterium]|nr:helix-turn-helix domain-containing protein [Flavobacteriales bacterium]
MAALAAQFVNSTDKHVFLTGKAGTGKTTFLRQLAASTHKRHVILAPTGIAALNANGVTIHSQFLLPFGTYLPDRNLPAELPGGTNFYTQQTLVRRHPLNSKRRDVLRNIDLLIIDEVSMLRADLLDAIDARLRFVKRNHRLPFGGVQLLMIGDMYQLPPIVKDHEWSKMRDYYASQHFFEARALKESGFVYVELDKIFRQRDDAFIAILNNLRNNTITSNDIQTLNEHYREERDVPENVVTLTTHNYKADNLNRMALDKLEGETFYFQADVKNDFPDHIFPVAESLELKKGARVMFVKNDAEGDAYYNGKLATVSSINEEEIEVLMDGASEPYVLKQEKWENKKYTVDETVKDLKEEVIGQFFQYPIKLAWAITVHKSQGLTFEKAVVDVGQAFAPGQVYVALSRLTSLDGLVLRTKIDPSVVSTDEQVVEFGKTKERQEPLPNILRNEQRNYLANLLANTFEFDEVTQTIQRILQKHDTVGQFEDSEMRSALDVLSGNMKAQTANTLKFVQQLHFCLQENDHQRLFERIEKGSKYYIEFVETNLRLLLKHIEEVKQFSRTKTYLDALVEIDLILMKKWEQMDKAHQVAQCIIEGREIKPNLERDTERNLLRRKLTSAAATEAENNPKNTKTKSGKTRKEKKEKGSKPEKGATYQLTYGLANQGLSIAKIAEAREMALTTIEGHIARGIQEKELTINKFMEEDDRETIEMVMKDNKSANSGEIYAKLNGKFSYGQIRMVQAHLNRS